MRQLLRITSIFSLTLVFATGMAFSQGNDAEVNQLGTSNDVTMDQVGTNDASVFQGKGFIFYPNGPSTGTAKNNTATINQDGDFTAFLGQGINGGIATSSEATITQSGTGGFGDVFQGVLGTADDAEATLTQNASGNTGFIRQGQVGTSIGDEATLTQAGSENDLGSILQGFGSNSTSTNNTATVIQNGNQNWSGTVLQGARVAAAGPGSGPGVAENNTATVIQNGNGDGTQDSGAARVHQGINGGSAFNNSGLIRQNGDFNQANIFQGSGTGIKASGTDASIYQYSDNNIATATQRGANNSATITQQN